MILQYDLYKWRNREKRNTSLLDESFYLYSFILILSHDYTGGTKSLSIHLRQLSWEGTEGTNCECKVLKTGNIWFDLLVVSHSLGKTALKVTVLLERPS